MMSRLAVAALAIFFVLLPSGQKKMGTADVVWPSTAPWAAVECSDAVEDFAPTLSASSLSAALEDINRWKPSTRHFHSQGSSRFSEYLSFAKEHIPSRQNVAMSALPHFRTCIDGIAIHFIHIKSNSSTPRPALLLHGWPGSYLEFKDMIQHVLRSRNDLDLVVPSLPGYAFSSAATRSGLGPFESAVLMSKLMHRLYSCQYVVHGGDWGGIIARFISLVDGAASGLHLNFFPVFPTPLTAVATLFASADDKARLFPPSRLLKTTWDVSGYFHEHATRPETISLALSSNFVAWSAWVFEKACEWSFRGCAAFSLDLFLENALLYWANDAIHSSTRMYSEFLSSRDKGILLLRAPIEIPVGLSEFPGEVLSPPSTVLPSVFQSIAFFRRHDKGGHFAAVEEPSIAARDFMDFMDIASFSLLEKPVNMCKQPNSHEYCV
jgi:pimeloyl-ACP methyl ester carboxylesterase